MPNKLLGQHFLNDPSGAIAKKMIAALAPARGEKILEIGPGSGALTRPLAEACKKSGAHLTAIEKDAELAKKLLKEFGGDGKGGAEIVSGDVREFLESARNGGKRWDKIIGNIPYYLTGHLLREVGEMEQKPERCVLMIQREVAERAMAEPPRMNRLAASVQFWAEPKIIAMVGKEEFTPPPQVDSAIVILKTRADDMRADDEKSSLAYYAAMRAVFAQPRKTVLNNVAATMKKMEKGDVAEKLRAVNINPEARPQNLKVKDIATIARTFF
jgi:16S rRNA (adenine1518-N6/adenine1519-N6)-dimethyltransferase